MRHLGTDINYIVLENLYAYLENQEDCIGNTHPACGGCLWAEGVLSCP